MIVFYLRKGFSIVGGGNPKLERLGVVEVLETLSHSIEGAVERMRDWYPDEVGNRDIVLKYKC